MLIDALASGVALAILGGFIYLWRYSKKVFLYAVVGIILLGVAWDMSGIDQWIDSL